MHLSHADIVFALIIGEGSAGVGDEAQGLVLEVAQAFEEVSRLAALLAPAPRWRVVGIGWRAFGVVLLQQGSVADSKYVGVLGGETPPGRVNRLIALDQQVLQGFRPGLAVLLEGPFQFAQLVGVAQAVEAVVAKIGFLVVMAQQAVETGQDADRVHGLGAAFGMGEEGGVAVIGGAM